MTKKGQALVEFIIILPVLIMLFFGSVDFGRIIIRKNELENLTSDVVKMYKENKSNNEINEFLRINNESNSFTITSNNNYVAIELQSEIDLITPGLNKILGSPYTVKVKRVIYHE